MPPENRVDGSMSQIHVTSNSALPLALMGKCKHLMLNGYRGWTWSCQTILNKARSWRGVVFWGAPVDLPGTKVPLAACLRRIWLTVAWVRSMRPAIALCCLPSWASASTLCLIAIRVGQGIIRTISENWEKYATVDSNLPECEGKFGEMTTQAAVLDTTWHWSESPAKVRSDFIGEQSQVHFMSVSAHWKHTNSIHIDSIASNGGVTTFFFSKSVCLISATVISYVITVTVAVTVTACLLTPGDVYWHFHSGCKSLKTH